MDIYRFPVACATHLLIAALVLPAPVSAQSSTKEVKISGMGIRKCAEWQQWKEVRNGEARAMVLEWAPNPPNPQPENKGGA